MIELFHSTKFDNGHCNVCFCFSIEDAFGPVSGVFLFPVLKSSHDNPHLNPLRAKFFREDINIYLYFMSFLHINQTYVVEIPPPVRQGPDYST